MTINLKHYQWSDGKPVTSRDVVFWINLLRANKVNWGEYAPGFFPDDVTKVAAPSTSQVVLTLNGPVNPQWFTESELTQISPLPQHAWDKTSATGKIGNYDTSTSGARAVYKFLASAVDAAADLRDQPAVAGRGRPVEAVLVQPQWPGQVRAELDLLRAGEALGRQLHRGAVHLRER